MLQETVGRVAHGDLLIVMGDMNTRVGNDTDIWGEVLGRHCEEVCNEVGRRILGSAVNTIFNLLELFACRQSLRCSLIAPWLNVSIAGSWPWSYVFLSHPSGYLVP